MSEQKIPDIPTELKTKTNKQTKSNQAAFIGEEVEVLEKLTWCRIV
jgi:hypothetical protein